MLVETVNLKRQKPGNRTCQEGELVCKVCEKKFNRKHFLIRHIESYNGMMEPEKQIKANLVELEETGVSIFLERLTLNSLSSVISMR